MVTGCWMLNWTSCRRRPAPGLEVQARPKMACYIGQWWVCLMELDVQDPWNREDGEDWEDWEDGEDFMMLFESRWISLNFWILDSPAKGSSKTLTLDPSSHFDSHLLVLRIPFPSWRGDFCGRAQCGAHLFGASFQLRHRHPTAALLAVEPGTPGVQWDDHGGTAATFWSGVTTDHSVHRRRGDTQMATFLATFRHHRTMTENIMGTWMYMADVFLV